MLEFEILAVQFGYSTWDKSCWRLWCQMFFQNCHIVCLVHGYCSVFFINLSVNNDLLQTGWSGDWVPVGVYFLWPSSLL